MNRKGKLFWTLLQSAILLASITSFVVDSWIINILKTSNTRYMTKSAPILKKSPLFRQFVPVQPFHRLSSYNIESLLARRRDDDDLDSFDEVPTVFDAEDEDDTFDDVDDEEDEDEDIDDDEELEDGDEESDSMEEDDILEKIRKESSWLERRRSEKRKEVRRVTWEDQYEDDPLTSSQPTMDYEKPPERFTRWYIAIADVHNDQIDRRGEAWLHHMQWMRRSALLPEKSEVVAAYTRLSADCMQPSGQVVILRSNNSIDCREFMQSEPLQIHSGVSPWKLYEMDSFDHENTTWYLTDPTAYIAYRGKMNNEAWSDIIHSSKEYHSSYNLGIRVSKYVELRDTEDFTSKGIFVLLNSKTLKRATSYISEDPLVKSNAAVNTTLSVVNVQDVSGRHHVMPRSFSEKAVLDQIHYMDPEDLLNMPVPTFPGLEDHTENNLKTLQAMKESNISYKYTRWGWSERYDGEITDKIAEDWNTVMLKAQKVRQQTIEEASSGGGFSTGDDIPDEDIGISSDDVSDIAID